MKLPRGEEWRRNVATAVDQDTWNGVQALHAFENGRVAEAIV